MKFIAKFVVFLMAAILASASPASAAFLCPVVGDGVLNADSRNGDNGVVAIEPPVGTSLLPGREPPPGGTTVPGNQAGANANPNAYNSDGPDNPDAGPGGNPDYSPIWP
jgi:hypothetical protein